MTSSPTLLGAGGHGADNQSYESGDYYCNVGLGRCPMMDDPFMSEAYVSQIIRAPGTISYLSWGSDTTFGATLTLTLRKNSSNTTLAVSIGSMAGWVTDSTDSVSVSSGDELDFDANVGRSVSYNGSFYCISARFDAATGSAQMLTTVGGTATTGFITPTTTPQFLQLVGVIGPDATETDQEFKCLTAGKWQNMACNIEHNTFGGTTTFNSRKGGSNGNMAISVSASVSGYFEDVSDYDAVNAGDLLCYGFASSRNGGSGEQFSVYWIGAHFIATDAVLCMIGGSAHTPTDILPNEMTYCSLFGAGNPYASDVTRSTGLFPYALTASNYTNHLTGADMGSGAATFTLLKNGSAALALTSMAGQTGYIVASTAVSFAEADTCANMIALKSGTNVQWSSAALLLQAST